MSNFKKDCIFCQIANKELNSFAVYEDEAFIAFLDLKPVFHGHCLVIPKTHIATLYELPQPLLQPYFSLVQKVGLAVEKAMGAEGSFIANNNKVSQSVPHLHTHIVPRTKGDGLKGFFWPRQKYKDDEHLKQVAELIKKRLF